MVVAKALVDVLVEDRQQVCKQGTYYKYIIVYYSILCEHHQYTGLMGSRARVRGECEGEERVLSRGGVEGCRGEGGGGAIVTGARTAPAAGLFLS